MSLAGVPVAMDAGEHDDVKSGERGRGFDLKDCTHVDLNWGKKVGVSGFACPGLGKRGFFMSAPTIS